MIRCTYVRASFALHQEIEVQDTNIDGVLPLASLLIETNENPKLLSSGNKSICITFTCTRRMSRWRWGILLAVWAWNVIHEVIIFERQLPVLSNRSSR